jgi:hypothetical protein
MAPLPPAPVPPATGPSKLAAWALACAIAPVAAYFLSAVVAIASFSPDGSGPPEVFGGVLSALLGVVGIAGPVAAIALGIAARRDPRTTQGGRTMALVALITLGLYVLFLLFILIAIATCAAACGSASSSHNGCVSLASSPGLAPCAVGLVTAPAQARPRWRDALAHHPDLPSLRADVFRVAGARLCVGCFTAYPVFAATFLAAWLWPVPAAVAWPAGLGLAALQAISTAGWTRWRWLKVAVKAGLGAGAALLAHAILAASWAPLLKSLAVAAGGLVALASAQPRLARIARLQAAS